MRACLFMMLFVGCRPDEKTLLLVNDDEFRLKGIAAQYSIKHQNCPETAAELIDACVADSDPVLKMLGSQKTNVRDPWGTAYLVQCHNRLEVRSGGPDRRYHTSDDITFEQDFSGASGSR
jgi:hypothetical protein